MSRARGEKFTKSRKNGGAGGGGTDAGSGGVNAAPVIENPGELIVPTITLYEIYKKLLVERGEEYALDVVSYMRTGVVIELNAALYTVLF
jgi:hypothetical protein